MERYLIVLKEEISRNWDEWLGNPEIEYLPGGNTQITGSVKDRSALHGVLNRIRDLGITLLKVEKL